MSPLVAGRRPLVVGFGNALRGDDAFGWFVAELIAEDPRFADTVVLAVHQLTPELAEDVARASQLVLLDAARSGAPGEIRMTQVQADGGSTSLRAGLLMSHRLDGPELIDLVSELYGEAPPTVMVTVGAGSTDVDAGFSSAVLAAIPTVIEAVAELCRPAERADA